MRTLYIDGDFICHTKPASGLREITTDAFNGRCDEFIEGYRFIPEGESWTREDGAVFYGMSISPLVDFKELDSAQRENEQAALKHVGLTGETAPIDQAIEMRDAIDAVASNIEDDIAINAPMLFSVWDGNGMQYKQSDRIRRNNELYKCLLDHVSQYDWAPETAVSLWVKISDPADEWPEWAQPAGGHDAYNIGDKVSYNGKRYISTVDGNVWKPGVYGWEVTAL